MKLYDQYKWVPVIAHVDKSRVLAYSWDYFGDIGQPSREPVVYAFDQQLMFDPDIGTRTFDKWFLDPTDLRTADGWEFDGKDSMVAYERADA